MKVSLFILSLFCHRRFLDVKLPTIDKQLTKGYPALFFFFSSVNSKDKRPTESEF